MAKFERPRAKALSDAELAQILKTFPSDSAGIERARALMQEQQLLREQDQRDLQNWIEAIRESGDASDTAELNRVMVEYFPPKPRQISNSEAEATDTSQLTVISRRQSLKGKSVAKSLVQFAAVIALLAGINLLITSWLGVQGLEAVSAIALGVTAASILVFPLRSHALHPILRSAAVFGGAGVYLFGGLVLGLLSLVYALSFGNNVEFATLAKLGPFLAPSVIAVTVSVAIGQLVSPKFGYLSFGLVAIAGLGLSETKTLDISPVLTDSWLVATLAIALVTSAVTIFGLPHTPSSVGKESGVAFGNIVVSSLAVLFLVPTSWTVALVISGLFVALVFSGRDLAAGSLGRWAGLAGLIGLLVSPVSDYLLGSSLSVLAAAAMLLLIDQIFRRQPLHIPSLDAKHGYYGSFQALSWIALLLAAVAGVRELQSYLPVSVDPLTLSLSLGGLIGLLIGLIRFFTVKRQEREVQTAGTANQSIENLLGL
jgi:hypothetical protein